MRPEEAYLLKSLSVDGTSDDGVRSQLNLVSLSVGNDSKPQSARTGPAKATGAEAASANAPENASLDRTQHLQSDGNDREFELHLPRGYDGKSPIPVVYMLHGLTENMDMMRQYSHMDQVADQKGFAVVYLQALPQRFPGTLGLYHENSWNLDHGTLTPKDPHYDDLDYLKAVKDQVGSQFNVDQHRQYLVGFSEGGEAAQYIAHELPKTFAGVGTVHSTLLKSDPRPLIGDPTAMISVLGNDDNVLPLDGGHGWASEGSLLKGFTTITVGKISQSQPLAQAPAWAAADGDNKETQRRENNEDVTDFTGGFAPVEQIVRLAHLKNGHWQGGQHAWDGGNGGWSAVPEPDLIQRISKWARQPDPDFDTSEVVIDFLSKFSKP